MNKLSLTKKILATACAVAGLTFVGGASEAADVDNQKSVLKPQNTLNIINDMNMRNTNPYFESINVVNSENSQVLKQIRNDKVSIAQDNNLSQTNGVLAFNNVSARSLNVRNSNNSTITRMGGKLTGAAAPTLDTMKTDAESVLPTASTYFGTTYALTEITNPSMDLTGKTVVAFNGKRYYYTTPTTLSSEKANMLNYLSGSTSVALTSTGATAANAVFKTVINDETTYYTFDTSKLPVSAYTGTTYSDFAFKNNSSDVATFENGASGNYDVKVSFDKDHTKYYSINIDPNEVSHIGSKVVWTPSATQPSGTWTNNIAGSNVTISGNNITGAIRIKTPHNGTVGGVNTWNKYFTYTYTSTYSFINDHAYTVSTLEAGEESAYKVSTSDRDPNVVTNAVDNDYGDITNKTYANNVLTANFSHNYNIIGGGAILNQGTIGDVVADFVGNRITSTTGSSNRLLMGGAIANMSVTSGETAGINSITGDFIGNSSFNYYSYGGAISNYANNGTASIGSIVGDFVGNSSSSSATKSYSYGGAIYNSGTISSITGDFIGNSSSASGYLSSSSGGAIANNKGTISSITGDFISNSSSASGSSSSSGGAISNLSGTISSITGDFINKLYHRRFHRQLLLRRLLLYLWRCDI